MLDKYLGRKGQSNIIVVVLIILAVIISIIIFWNIFNPFLRESVKEVNTDILKNEIELREAGLFLTGASRVNVLRRTGNLTIDSLKFVFEDESGRTHLESVNENIPRLLESTSYFFSPIENFGKIKKVSAYPVINGKDGIGSSVESSSILNIPSGLVSLWKFDGNLEDSVGGNTGNINGNVEFANEEGRKSLHFNSGYVDLGKDLSLDIKREFAIVFWIKTNSSNTEILKKGSTKPNYGLGIDKNGRIDFSFSSKGITKSKKTSKIIGDGKWHHLVFTNMMVYIDGEADKILNVNDALDTNQENLILGEGFNGYIGEFMFFNKSLDMSQAKGIYKNYD